MAPERPTATLSRAHTPKEIPHIEAEWPLPARVVRQIQRQVARAGRSLQRLEVQGTIIDNFDSLGPLSPPSPHHQSIIATVKKEHEYYEEVNVDSSNGNNGVDGLVEDNDLTNLTWLQDSNLLRSINLAKGDGDEMRPVTVQISPQSGMSGASPTSDYLEDSFTSEPADSNSSGDQLLISPCISPAPHTPIKAVIPNGFLHSSKSNGSSLKLKHPHNVPYNPLVHIQNKPPYSFSCLIFMAIENSPKKALPVKDIYSWILEHFPYFRNAPTGWKNSVRHNLSLNKCFLKVEKVQSLGKGSLWMVDDHYRNNLLQAFSRSPFHPCCPTAHSPSPSRPSSPMNSDVQDSMENNGVKGAPNPELFPFLSRRLAESTTKSSELTADALSDHDSCDSLDEVVAAAMVLALKHGPGVLPPPLISSCPTQDHTYSAATGSPEAGYGSDEEQRRTAEALLHLAGLPPAPEEFTEAAHRPRLLRKAPKRAAPTSFIGVASEHQAIINNNCGSQADRNLIRVKRSRQQHF
ncbi:uncharacterized protein LOC143923059 isoform X2 [Arctopsyche grandis]|uniref:uncharacterized protein LOC143923059 isoform X2 n=1 Tax=Arctopsyche grandis TaxID=121162 RepID=UPI00406D65F3